MKNLGAINTVANILAAHQRQEEKNKPAPKKQVEAIKAPREGAIQGFCHACNKQVTDVTQHDNEVHRQYKH
jgi:hypothetical protein